MRLPHVVPLSAALLVTVLVAAFLTGCGSEDTTTPRAEKGQCEYADDPAGATKEAEKPPADPPEDLPTEMTIATNRGDIKVSLDIERAPCNVNAFVALAEQGYFDNTHCHRLTGGNLSVLQCGDPKATGKPDDEKAGQGGPGFYSEDELVDNDPRLQPCFDQLDPATDAQYCTYTTGTLAMANAGPDTAGSQFFLVYKDSPLPNSYTAFGRMSAAGVKVVQGIAAGGSYPQSAQGNTAPKLETVITAVK